ncbi:hypothetical protein SRHO_G00066090 [Serrasalmus rhombeus]
MRAWPSRKQHPSKLERVRPFSWWQSYECSRKQTFLIHRAPRFLSQLEENTGRRAAADSTFEDLTFHNNGRHHP